MEADNKTGEVAAKVGANSAPFTIEVMSLVIPETSPIDVDQLVSLIEQKYSPNQQLSVIVDEISKKTSKYKFLGQSTIIESGNDLSVQADYSAIWDVAKDGYISLKVQGIETSTVLITVFWIYVD